MPLTANTATLDDDCAKQIQRQIPNRLCVLHARENLQEQPGTRGHYLLERWRKGATYSKLGRKYDCRCQIQPQYPDLVQQRPRIRDRSAASTSHTNSHVFRSKTPSLTPNIERASRTPSRTCISTARLQNQAAADGMPQVPRTGSTTSATFDAGGRTSTTGRGNQADRHAAALARHLRRHCVGLADLVTPVATADRDDGHLGCDDRAADRGRHLLRALHPEPAVAVVVADDDKGLEACALAGAGLLLHWHDLHDLVLERAAEELLDDLVLLHGQREEVDLLHRLDLHAQNGALQRCSWA